MSICFKCNFYDNKHILAILTLVVFGACGQQKNDTSSNNVNQTSDTLATNEDQITETDSAKFMQYIEYIGQMEEIDVYNYDLSALSKIEKNRDTAMLLNFLVTEYPYERYESFQFEPNELVKSVYSIDFNDDGLLDIIYNGPSGGEPTIAQFFLNKGDHYENVFEGFQDITKVDFSNNKLNSFVLINPGCCADHQIVEYYYLITYSDKKPLFKLNKTIGYLSPTEKPQKLFSSPKKFSVLTNNTKLRSDCYKYDNSEHPVNGNDGNTLATYKTGSKGVVLGMKKDKNNEWVYVLMDAKSKKLDNCVFPTFQEQPTQLKGWMLKEDTDFK